MLQLFHYVLIDIILITLIQFQFRLKILIININTFTPIDNSEIIFILIDFLIFYVIIILFSYYYVKSYIRQLACNIKYFIIVLNSVLW